MRNKDDRRRRAQQLEHAHKMILRRNREQLVEFYWALFDTPIPRKQKIPPIWVGNALRHGWRDVVQWKQNLSANPTWGSVVEMTGAHEALDRCLIAPAPLQLAEEKRIPEIATLRKAVTADVAKILRPKLAKWDKVMRRMLRQASPADPTQFQENLTHLQRGASVMVEKDGNLAVWSAKNRQLALAMAFWWPWLVHTKNAREVRAALAEVGCEFSQELVSKLCSKFEMFKGRRGRPRTRIIGR